MFETPEKLALGFVTGFIFGFLLQKGRVAKYHVILGQLLLKDWTVVKIMLTAILVGAIGVYLLIAMNLAELHVKPMLLGGVVFGGGCCSGSAWRFLAIARGPAWRPVERAVEMLWSASEECCLAPAYMWQPIPCSYP